jgi:hypothetical protein
MNGDKSSLRSESGNILLKSAIVTVLLLLCSAPLLLLFLSALSGPIGFLLILVSMLILQVPLVWILVRFKVLPKVAFGRPSESLESSSMNVSD